MISTGGCNTLKASQAEGELQMKQRPRINYTETQKAVIGEHWQKGDALGHIKTLDGLEVISGCNNTPDTAAAPTGDCCSQTYRPGP